jgi:hypothetical protein
MLGNVFSDLSTNNLWLQTQNISAGSIGRIGSWQMKMNHNAGCSGRAKSLIGKGQLVLIYFWVLV